MISRTTVARRFESHLGHQSMIARHRFGQYFAERCGFSISHTLRSWCIGQSRSAKCRKETSGLGPMGTRSLRRPVVYSAYRAIALGEHRPPATPRSQRKVLLFRSTVAESPPTDRTRGVKDKRE